MSLLSNSKALDSKLIEVFERSDRLAVAHKQFLQITFLRKQYMELFSEIFYGISPDNVQ